MTEVAYSADTSFDGMLAASGVLQGMDQTGDAPDTTYLHKAPMGRPALMTPELKETALVLAAEGACEREIAAELNIHVLTLYRAKQTDPDFCNALNDWKAVADEQVEKSLFMRAKGFTHRTEKLFSYQGEIVRAEVNEYVLPDTGAATLWLKNRQPDKWRDRSDVNVSLSLMDILAQAIAPTAEQPAIEGTARDVTPPDAPDDAE